MGRNFKALVSCRSEDVLDFKLVVLVLLERVFSIFFITAVFRDSILTAPVEDLVSFLHRNRLLLTKFTGEALVGLQDVIAFIACPKQGRLGIREDSIHLFNLVGLDIKSYDSRSSFDKWKAVLGSLQKRRFAFAR